MESTYYPKHERGDQTSPYYVEFNRGGRPNEFTLFQRHFFYTIKQLAEMKANSDRDFAMLEMCNEVHPWNIYTAEFGPDGCMPDKQWVCWMVDALNEKYNAQASQAVS